MKFLALVIALLLLRFWGSGERIQCDDWFSRWQSRVASWQLAEPLALIMVLLLPGVLAAVLLAAVEDLLFGLVWIVLAAVLVLYALGRGNLAVLQERYREQCATGDFQGALHGTLPVLGARVDSDPHSPEDVHQLVLRAFYYYGYQRWFAPLFWFVLAGPSGALVYRLLQLRFVAHEEPLAGRVLQLADWLPSRLLAATFALAGDFVRSRQALAEAWQHPQQSAADLILRVGCAAGTPEARPDQSIQATALIEHNECAALLSRSASIWVAVLAFLVVLL